MKKLNISLITLCEEKKIIQFKSSYIENKFSSPQLKVHTDTKIQIPNNKNDLFQKLLLKPFSLLHNSPF